MNANVPTSEYPNVRVLAFISGSLSCTHQATTTIYQRHARKLEAIFGHPPRDLANGLQDCCLRIGENEYIDH